MKLREWLPVDDHLVSSRLLDHEVVAENRGPWPGRQKNVRNWVVLDSGHAVGWNENPVRLARSVGASQRTRFTAEVINLAARLTAVPSIIS